MIEELKEESLITKVGGRFKLSTLIQKRLVSLNKGARSFVDTEKKEPMQVVIQEILEDRIYLDFDNNLVERRGDASAADIAGLDFTDSVLGVSEFDSPTGDDR
ncbi:MAG TPA: DNA-directed RNA polymerase subunit omega [Planctomycetaceae bacterium]|nr:DNA-directed RNA polymerase subunit omega [Planctomycetaceae bacterium]